MITEIVPPRLAEAILRRILPGEKGDCIRGDLLEELAVRTRTDGPRAARIAYWRDALSLAVRARSMRGGAPRRPEAGAGGSLPSLGLRQALRALLRRPIFTAVAVATLALGVGTTSAIVSVVDAVLLRPLPYRDPGRLVVVWGAAAREGAGRRTLSHPDFVDLRAQNRAFEDMALTSGPESLTLIEDGRAERVIAEYVTANYFPLLGFGPALGRGFLPEEDLTPDTHRVAILSHAFWTRRFLGDASVLGRTVRLNEQLYTVVGVLRPGFNGGTDHADLWLPFKSVGLAFPGADYVNDRGIRWAVSHARLRPGLTLEQARADLEGVAIGLAAQHPDTNAGIGVALEPMVESWLGELRAPLLLLLCAVGLVMAAVAANLGHLQLIRGIERVRDLSLRRALGASTKRLALELAAEGAWLGGVAAALGLLLASGILHILPAYAPLELPSFARVTLEPRVAIATLAVALALGVVSSLAPLARRIPTTPWAGGRGQTGSRSQLRSAHALTVSQVALAVVLVAGALLLGKSFLTLARADTGFEVRGLLTARAHLGSSRYHEAPAVTAVSHAIVERLAALPGAKGAAVSQSDLPPRGFGLLWEMEIEGRPVLSPRDRIPSNLHRVTPAFFDVLRVKVRAGRAFSASDTVTAAPVAIVGESFARRHWPDGKALGRRLRSLRPEDDGRPAPWLEIVGVVADVRYREPLEKGVVEPDVYRPLAQQPALDPRHVYLVVRGEADTASLAPALRAAVASVDPEVPVYEVATMEERFGTLISGPRFLAGLLGVFALGGAGLAALGLYGVTAYGVAQRRREVGTRVALGARPAEILALFLGGAARLSAAGIGLGLATAAALSRVLGASYYGVRPADPLVLGATAVLVALVTVVATVLPARRALRIDPAEALRAD